MKQLESMIDRLTNNIKALDEIFSRIDGKHFELKKYALKVNKLYLDKVDSWIINDDTENKYLKIPKRKLSTILFNREISMAKTDIIIKTLSDLNLIIIVDKDVYDIPEYNTYMCINKIKERDKINQSLDDQMTKRELKTEQNRLEACKLVKEYVLKEIKSKEYAISYEVETYFNITRQFGDITRRVRVGIDQCAEENGLIVVLCDKTLKTALNIKFGYPKVILTKRLYKTIEMEKKDGN